MPTKKQSYEFKKVLGHMTTEDQFKMAQEGWSFAGKVSIDGR